MHTLASPMGRLLKNIGPGTLVTAAFIGPGTVTLCTLAGVNFGFTLLWAMTLSVISTLVLQEMAARIGIITHKGLAEVIKEQITHPAVRFVIIGLIIGAIIIGNASYEAGNISGATLGLEAVFGQRPNILYTLIVGVAAFVMLWIGSYKTLERSLVALVIVMSLSFIITSVITKPDLAAMIKGMFVPRFPKNSILTIIGLIGTTVVPYNLFLHAALVKEKWKDEKDLEASKKDTFISITLGGIVSMAIIVSAAAIQHTRVSNAMDLARGLEPLYGNSARYFLGAGLFAAGITSAITAPLAAAYVANGCFGWQAGLRDFRFRLVWILILVLGISSLGLGYKPIEIIKFAQVANGLLLPVIAVFLLWVVNKSNVLGKYRNTLFQNILAVAVIIISIGLGIRTIMTVLGLL